MSDKLVKTALCLALFVSLFACSSLGSASANTPSPADIEREEQAVYSFFINPADGPALILENTSTGISNDDSDRTIDYIRSGIEDVSNETIDNHFERNQQPIKLSSSMKLDADYILLTSEELAKISSRPNWGELLTEKFPGAHGYTIFSCVGFNSTLDQALIYVGYVGGPLVGSGSYYLLEKQNGGWILKDQIEVWIS